MPSPWQRSLRSSGSAASQAGGLSPPARPLPPRLPDRYGAEDARPTAPPCGAPYANVIICICKYANAPALVRAAGGEEREGVQEGAGGGRRGVWGPRSRPAGHGEGSPGWSLEPGRRRGPGFEGGWGRAGLASQKRLSLVCGLSARTEVGTA